jgi:uncharacterized membrane protein
MFRYGYGMHHGPGVFGWVVLVLIVAALAVGIVALVRWSRHPAANTPVGSWPATAHGPSVDPALAELRLRYARGDITWEEYAQRAANLGFPVGPNAGPRVDPAAPPPS